VIVIGLKSVFSGSAYEHLHGGLWIDGDNDTSPLELRAARLPQRHGAEPPISEQPRPPQALERNRQPPILTNTWKPELPGISVARQYGHARSAGPSATPRASREVTDALEA
jgi:hypothetical protein